MREKPGNWAKWQRGFLQLQPNLRPREDTHMSTKCNNIFLMGYKQLFGEVELVKPFGILRRRRLVGENRASVPWLIVYVRLVVSRPS